MEIPIFLFIPLLSGCAPISPLYPPIPFQLFRPVCRFSLVSCEVLAQCSPPSLLELLPHFPARLWGLTSPPPPCCRTTTLKLFPPSFGRFVFVLFSCLCSSLIPSLQSSNFQVWSSRRSLGFSCAFTDSPNVPVLFIHFPNPFP